MLLLCGTIRRLDWARLIREPGFGARRFQALLAGAGMRLLFPWHPGQPIEPAVALLAGMLEEPDRLGLAQVFETTPLAALPLFPQAVDWPAALESAADALAADLAGRVRGFRQSRREAAVRQFLRIPGRILVNESALRVLLEPTPWSVALHISGVDDAVESAEWLGGRRVSYVLEGL
jgi:hypothetical protein